MNVTLKELLDYLEGEQAKWQQWFAAQGDEPLRIPLAGDRQPTLGALIQHALGTELWFAERLRETAFTEWWKQPADRAAELFHLGSMAKQAMRELIQRAGPEDWSRMVELTGQGQRIRVSARKAVANALIHELRHWAQVAALVRQQGMAPPGDHDLICAPVME